MRVEVVEHFLEKIKVKAPKPILRVDHWSPAVEELLERIAREKALKNMEFPARPIQVGPLTLNRWFLKMAPLEIAASAGYLYMVKNTSSDGMAEVIKGTGIMLASLLALGGISLWKDFEEN